MVRLALLALAAVLIAGCGDDAGSTATTTSAAQQQALARSSEVEEAVRAWADAATLAEAQAAAERARNLVTGPRVPGAGDADDNGEVDPVSVGLLPGDDGSPGLASDLPGACVEQDVLGGAWDDPQARWNGVLERIAAWRPDDNRFPELPSHAQRVVGWASLTLGANDLAEAKEYAGHALGHAQITTAALSEPDAEPCPGG